MPKNLGGKKAAKPESARQMANGKEAHHQGGTMKKLAGK